MTESDKKALIAIAKQSAAIKAAAEEILKKYSKNK